MASLVFRQLVAVFATLRTYLNSVAEGLQDMRLSYSQIEAIKQETEHFFGAQAEVWLFDSRVGDNQRGFTLVELIMVMVIVGILGAVVAPRFFDANVFKSRGFADQVQATLRYAQKEAIAQHRNVCVAVAAGTITLTIANASGASIPCGPNLALPAGGNFITTPSAAITITLSPAAPATIIFDALGKPFDALGTPSVVQKTITISGATNNIVVEAETGYVHSP